MIQETVHQILCKCPREESRNKPQRDTRNTTVDVVIVPGDETRRDDEVHHVNDVNI